MITRVVIGLFFGLALSGAVALVACGSASDIEHFEEPRTNFPYGVLVKGVDDDTVSVQVLGAPGGWDVRAMGGGGTAGGYGALPQPVDVGDDTTGLKGGVIRSDGKFYNKVLDKEDIT